MRRLLSLVHDESFVKAYCVRLSRHTALIRNYRHPRGFTLLEIMIALVILAIALSAASFAISRNAQNATYIDQKTAAHWVAMNIMSKQQLKAQQPDFNETDNESGVAMMLNHSWYWKSQTESVAVDHTYRIDVAVSATVNGPVTEHLEGYVYHVTTN